MDFLKIMKFGFEFEILIVKNEIFKIYENKFIDNNYQQEFIKIMNEKLGIDCERYVRDGSLVSQYILASILNDESEKESFSVSIYDSENNKYINFNHNINDKNIKREWSIVYDGSVELENNYFDNYIYYTSEGIFVNGNILKSVLTNTEDVIEGIEIVSPIMDIEYIKTDLKNFSIPSFQIFCEKCTSNHVHISCIDQNNINLLKDCNNLIKICIGWSVFEPILLLLVAPWRRYNSYTTPITLSGIIPFDIYDKKDYKKLWNTLFQKLNICNYSCIINDLIDSIKDRAKAYQYMDQNDLLRKIVYLFSDVYIYYNQRNSRYKALNLTNLIEEDSIGTIEIRIKQGSCDFDENSKFVLLLGYFINALLMYNDTANNYVLNKNDIDGKNFINIIIDLAYSNYASSRNGDVTPYTNIEKNKELNFSKYYKLYDILFEFIMEHNEQEIGKEIKELKDYWKNHFDNWIKFQYDHINIK